MRKLTSGRWREIFQLLSPPDRFVSRKILDRGWRESKGVVWRTNLAREKQEAACPQKNVVQRDLCARPGRQGGLLVFSQSLATFLVPRAPESLVPETVWRESHSPSYPAIFYQTIPTALWKERHCPRMRLPATPSSIVRHLLSSSPAKGRRLGWQVLTRGYSGQARNI